MSIPPSTRSGETVITFDDLCDEGRPMGALPDGYAGFIWSASAWFLTREFSPSMRTGHRAALFNANGEDLFFEREHAFHLKELSLSLLWADSAHVIIEGQGKHTRQCRKALTVSRATATEPLLKFGNINRAYLKTNGAHLVITTITVRVQET